MEGLSGPRRGVRNCEDAADLQQGLADNGRVAMVGEVPIRVCLDELRDSIEPAVAQVLARERRIALLDGIEPAVTHGLTMAYARVDVEAPEALIEQLIGQIDPLRESRRLRQVYEKQMGNAKVEAREGGKR